ncbi:hypothetical protein SAMN02787144_1006163 [Streptomyces atratus]|uniref:Uncharacterized protein n=1 Tax=Streptomyces atratus TaxID=1893 RepID=A0A1K1ZXR0_STRAR|nr:hypothetical protein SAMN02787144_1006163 [Streptomyces atratus]
MLNSSCRPLSTPPQAPADSSRICAVAVTGIVSALRVCASGDAGTARVAGYRCQGYAWQVRSCAGSRPVRR